MNETAEIGLIEIVENMNVKSEGKNIGGVIETVLVKDAIAHQGKEAIEIKKGIKKEKLEENVNDSEKTQEENVNEAHMKVKEIGGEIDLIKIRTQDLTT